jgi:hypothetical protein
VVGYKDIDKRNLALCRRQLTWGMFFSNICSLISGPCMTMVGFAQHLGRRQVSLGMDAKFWHYDALLCGMDGPELG